MSAADPADWVTFSSDAVAAATGHRPGLWGADFLWYGGHQDQLVAEAKEQWRDGSLVTLMWHQCRPKVAPSPCSKDPRTGTPGETLTDAEWTELLTDGTALHQAWLRDLDEVAGYLLELRDAGVGVLWRPYHEMNDDWIWWAGQGERSRQLFAKMHDYYDLLGLTDLVWVWNVTDRQTDRWHEYLPAARHVDVLSLDLWNSCTIGTVDNCQMWDGDEPTTTEYDTLVRLAAGRPIALGETKTVPTAELLARQPRWSWFMQWPEFDSENPPARLRATYAAAAVLDQADLRRPSPAEPGVDLARNRTALAKTSENPWMTARWATDGDSRTRWSSTYVDDQWLYVELAEAAVIRQVRLDWEAARAKKYQIQLSADGITWRTAATVTDTGASPALRDITITDPAPARYVKVYAWERLDTRYGYSLWSMSVYGD